MAMSSPLRMIKIEDTWSMRPLDNGSDFFRGTDRPTRVPEVDAMDSFTAHFKVKLVARDGWMSVGDVVKWITDAKGNIKNMLKHSCLTFLVAPTHENTTRIFNQIVVCKL